MRRSVSAEMKFSKKEPACGKSLDHLCLCENLIKFQYNIKETDRTAISLNFTVEVFPPEDSKYATVL